MSLLRTVSSAFVLVAIAGVAAAGPIDPNARASEWSSATSSERMSYARRVAAVCPSSGKCGSVEIKACMDEALRPPIPAAARNMSIGEAAVTCISMLK
jgi:hypothetical protein